MINAAKSGQTITFEFGEWNSFPRSFMEKLVNKSANGVTFVFHIQQVGIGHLISWIIFL